MVLGRLEKAQAAFNATLMQNLRQEIEEKQVQLEDEIRLRERLSREHVDTIEKIAALDARMREQQQQHMAELIEMKKVFAPEAERLTLQTNALKRQKAEQEQLLASYGVLEHEHASLTKRLEVLEEEVTQEEAANKEENEELSGELFTTRTNMQSIFRKVLRGQHDEYQQQANAEMVEKAQSSLQELDVLQKKLHRNTNAMHSAIYKHHTSQSVLVTKQVSQQVCETNMKLQIERIKQLKKVRQVQEKEFEMMTNELETLQEVTETMKEDAMRLRELHAEILTCEREYEQNRARVQIDRTTVMELVRKGRRKGSIIATAPTSVLARKAAAAASLATAAKIAAVIASMEKVPPPATKPKVAIFNSRGGRNRSSIDGGEDGNHGSSNGDGNTAEDDIGNFTCAHVNMSQSGRRKSDEEDERGDDGGADDDNYYDDDDDDRPDCDYYARGGCGSGGRREGGGGRGGDIRGLGSEHDQGRHDKMWRASCNAYSAELSSDVVTHDIKDFLGTPAAVVETIAARQRSTPQQPWYGEQQKEALLSQSNNANDGHEDAYHHHHHLDDGDGGSLFYRHLLSNGSADLQLSPQQSFLLDENDFSLLETAPPEPPEPPPPPPTAVLPSLPNMPYSFTDLGLRVNDALDQQEKEKG